MGDEAMADAARRAALARLKAQVRAIEIRIDDEGLEERAHRRLSPRLSLGAPELDAVLGGGLGPGLHELRPARYFDAPAAVAALAGVTARAATMRPGPVLWARAPGGASAAHDFGALDPMGLASFGLDPARIVLVETSDARELLWAMEEGARSRGLAAVAAEIGPATAFDHVAARRLQLAAKRAEGLVLALRGANGHAPSPSQTRWVVAAEPGAEVPWRGASAMPGLGRSRIALTLERAGDVAGLPRSFTVEWDDAACGFRLAEPMADRPARADRGGRLPLRRAG